MNPFKIDNNGFILSGIHFRSKSELNFAQLLSSYDIQFWYEPELKLNDGTIIFPDFLVKRKSDNKKIIIEYFGMIADDKYRENAHNKLELYHNNGYKLWDDLIAIFEYKSQSLDMDVIDRIIKTFFL